MLDRKHQQSAIYGKVTVGAFRRHLWTMMPPSVAGLPTETGARSRAIATPFGTFLYAFLLLLAANGLRDGGSQTLFGYLVATTMNVAVFLSLFSGQALAWRIFSSPARTNSHLPIVLSMTANLAVFSALLGLAQSGAVRLFFSPIQAELDGVFASCSLTEAARFSSVLSVFQSAPAYVALQLFVGMTAMAAVIVFYAAADRSFARQTSVALKTRFVILTSSIVMVNLFMVPVLVLSSFFNAPGCS